MWEYNRVLYKVEWQYITDDYIQSDSDFIWAYDAEDALDKFMIIDDVPEGAEILSVVIA